MSGPVTHRERPAPQPEEITVAVTVYSRREFIRQAVRGALEQTVPVRVIVVEDCGPDAGLRDFVGAEFGNRIQYFRNPQNRGLFDNWNACLEYCGTPWLSILHDDDELRPNFVEALLNLARVAPGRGVYFGRSGHVTGNGLPKPLPGVSWPDGWRDIDLAELADESIVGFPGHLMSVADAKAVGGFRQSSYFTGDWDMWFRLAIAYGAAQTAAEVALSREHFGGDRGTSRVERKGWKWALDNVQRKRNLQLLQRETGRRISFDRTKLLAKSPIPSRTLLRDAAGYSRRALRYNAQLFVQSRAPNFGYAVLQQAVRVFGPDFLRTLARLKNS